MKILILILTLISSSTCFAQKKCFFIRKSDHLAYKISDSTSLFSGHCNYIDHKGRLISQINYNNGVCVYIRNWYKNGVLKDSTIFKTDRPENTYDLYAWWRNGKLKTVQVYQRDTIVSCMFYSRKGNINRQEHYSKGIIVNPVYQWDIFGHKHEIIVGKIKNHKHLGFTTVQVISNKRVDQ